MNTRKELNIQNDDVLLTINLDNKKRRYFPANLTVKNKITIWGNCLDRYFTYDNRPQKGNDGPKKVLDIFDIYKRPSTTKYNIWDEWKTFLAGCGAYNVSCVFGNCMTFSISANLNINGQKYGIFITKYNNTIYPLI